MKLNRLVAAVTTFALGATALADEAGEQLRAKVIEAYKKTDTERVEIRFEVVQVQGRWTNTQATDMKVAIDRSGGRLLVEAPNVTLASDGTKLRAKSDAAPGRHLEIDAPKPIDYAGLLADVEGLDQPPVPELALLLAEDPVAALNEGRAADVTAVAPADGRGPGLRFESTFGSAPAQTTLWIDPQTNLVTGITSDIDVSKVMKNGRASMAYKITRQSHNQPLDASAFALDTTGSEAVASVDEWRSAAQSAAGEGHEGHGHAPGPAHELEGKPAPPLELKTVDGKDYKLADDKADVVVLDFWATWCGPCRVGLPKLQAVAEWVKKENKNAAIYTVNMQETADEVNAFWAENKYTMPVLMDADTKVANAYGVQGIPQTVVIHKGKVVHVVVGLDPNGEENLKKQIDDLLSKK